MISLIYGSTTVQLRNPQMGNTDSLEFTRLSRNTAGGDQLIYRDPAWPKIERLVFTVDTFNEKEIEDLKVFIKLTLGKEITYIDFEGIFWSALITNPNTAIKQGGVSSYIVQLELEAEKL